MTEADSAPESLAAFHGRFRDCFARREVWEQFHLCLRERLGEAASVAGPDPDRPAQKMRSARSRQRFLTDAVWNEESLRTRYHEAVRETLGDRDGIIVFAEAPFARRGSLSAGAAPQPAGRGGRLRNVQTGIFAIYVTRHGAALVDARLFVPEAWFGVDRKEARAQCRFPECLTYRSREEIVLEMLAGLRATDILPFRYVWYEPPDGSAGAFIRAVEEGGWSACFLPAPADAAVLVTREISWMRPVKHWWTWYSKKKRVLTVKKIPKALSPWAYIRTLPLRAWHEQPVPGAAPALVRTEFARRRVLISLGRESEHSCWLFARRVAGKRPAYAYYISSAHSRVRLAVFVRLSGAGEAAKRCLADVADESGLGRYAVRSWPGWHRHMLTAMLAHFFRFRG